MPEKIIEAAAHRWDQLSTAMLFAAVGVVIGLSQLLASNERLTLRIIVGRSVSNGGLAMAAGLVLVWMPDLPLLGQLGVAAALASLGTSGLERVFQRAISARG